MRDIRGTYRLVPQKTALISEGLEELRRVGV